MIAKIVKGRGFRGALNYLFQGNRATIIGGNLSGLTPRELAAEFGQFRKLRPAVGKAVVHIPLSAHPEDRPMTDAEMAEIADRFTRGMGYADSPHVFVRHNDTDHQHMHLLLCRVDRHGNAVSESNDYRNAEQLLRQIERDYRLRTVDAPGAKTPKHKKNTPKEDDMNTQQEPLNSTEHAEPIEPDGDGSGLLTMVSPEAAKPGNTGTRFKRESRRKVLTDDYEQQLRALWGQSFRYCRFDRGLVLYFDKPKQIRDEGSKVSAKGFDEQEAAQKLVAVAVAKGWKAVSFTGTTSFVKEAIRQAMHAGLEVVPADMSQVALIDEVKAEVAASMLTARMEPSTSDLLQRLHERRKKFGQVPSAPAQKTDSPRHGPIQPT